jgi:hypothetical protein
MMDCATARRLIDEGEDDCSLAVHLHRCAACRKEAESDRQVTAAVAAMPRVAAPDALRRRVMDQLRTTPAVRPARRTPLALQPWEIGWIGAACLLLTLIVCILPPWGSWRAALVPAAFPVAGVSLPPAGFSAMAQAWTRGLTGLFGPAGMDRSAWSGVPAAWWCGALGFMLGFFSLLTWHGKGGPREEWEGHA